ncbi:hypothetical protein [Serratia fonticola]|uniref:hypothetical protein n=1 Tax=Serratia fonticola TaxID=47917 RepID=UPI00137759B7|nr:hypothetical protein [Serratia fonticola]NCG54911.1 hypothetical protein [Serratia fonticola]
MDKAEREHFITFPYKYEVRDNGSINNGGIDLVKSPERINEIHELYDYPWLKGFVETINSESGKFMTLGCQLGDFDGYLMGYVDLAFRPELSNDLKNDAINLDVYFYEYLRDAMSAEENHAQAIQYAQQILHFLLSPLEIYDKTYSKVTVTFRAKEEDGIYWAMDHLACFLHLHYPLLPHVANTK